MQKQSDMPLWVFLGLMNIETRKGALILLWSCVALTVICIPVSYYLQDWSWFGMMAAMSVWYWLCVRWVDSRARWDGAAPEEGRA